MSDPKKIDGKLTIRDRLKNPTMIAELGKAMPKHCSPERMARVALTALMRVPLLAECTEASFFKCLLDLSQWGLEPDGRRAHLIPFKNNKTGEYEVQLIIDYKGLAELAHRSGSVTSIHADVIHEGDVFQYNLGKVLAHVPWFLRRDADKPAVAGDVIGAYCHVDLKDGASKSEVLSRDEIEAIRARSKASKFGPWVTDWCEMAKKSAFRRVSKWLPLSADLHDVLDRDEDKFESIDHTLQRQPQERMNLDSLAGMLESSVTSQTQSDNADVKPQQSSRMQEIVETIKASTDKNKLNSLIETQVINGSGWTDDEVTDLLAIADLKLKELR